MHKSTPANFSLPRDGYIRFWQPEDALPMPGDKLSGAALMQNEVSIMEIKGQTTAPFTVELPVAENRYWLVFQFIGTFSPPAGAPLDAGYYSLFQPGIGTKSFRFDTNHKIWALMLGIPDNGLDAMRIEWQLPFADDWPTAASSNHQKGLPIGYRQQEVLKKLQQLQWKPYSTAIKLQNALVEFMNILQADLLDAEKSANLQQVALYHRAVDYIRKHYMDAGLSRDAIADALYVSVRTLTRAFEGKSNNVISTIRMVRLHRARELLRGTDRTLEDIAVELHFTDAKHLGKMYQKLFDRSPATDRRELPLWRDRND